MASRKGSWSKTIGMPTKAAPIPLIPLTKPPTNHAQKTTHAACSIILHHYPAQWALCYDIRQHLKTKRLVLSARFCSTLSYARKGKASLPYSPPIGNDISPDRGRAPTTQMFNSCIPSSVSSGHGKSLLAFSAFLRHRHNVWPADTASPLTGSFELSSFNIVTAERVSQLPQKPVTPDPYVF